MDIDINETRRSISAATATELSYQFNKPSSVIAT